ELRVPWADGFVVVAEDADEVRGERVSLGRGDAGVGARRGTGRGDVQRRKIGRIAGAERWLGHVQRELRRVAAQAWILIAHVSPARRLDPLARCGNCRSKGNFT